MRFVFSILVLILIASVLWIMLSPVFSKVGKFFGKKANNFKKKWGMKE